MTLHKKLVYFSGVLTTAGIIGLVPYGYMWNVNQQAAAGPTTTVTTVPLSNKPTLVTGKPVRLSIPSLSLELEIADGVYNQQDGSWTLSNDKAHYALPTTPPNNERGNTLVYGHNRREVFAGLSKLTKGAEATITTDNGYRLTYTYGSYEVVDPTDTSIFAYDGPPRLTLQTCSGTWFQDRQFFYFEYTGYEKI